MRSLLAVLVLALLVAGCGGGGESAAPTATTLSEFDAGQLIAYERAVHVTQGTGGTADERQAAIDGATTAGLIAIDNPTATFPSAIAPGVDLTARMLLEWVSIYGNPEPALAARDALDVLP